LDIPSDDEYDDDRTVNLLPYGRLVATCIYTHTSFQISDSRSLAPLAEFGLQKACLPSISDINTGSAASISRIHGWLGTCISSHPKCDRMETHLPPLPTRVIALGGKRSKICRLVPGVNKRGKYATLSHCWGSSNNQPLKTTDETITLRPQGMKDGELPKTFEEAVQVCRQLGIKYLWIDSLCIIQDQDSQEDWGREAPKMGEVYGNSVLTIFATASGPLRIALKGFSGTASTFASSPARLSCSVKEYIVFRFPKSETFSDPGDIDTSQFNPLNHRGWVLQEQVLSRRSLVFTPDYIIWRCASMSTDEKYPLGIPLVAHIEMDNYRVLHCLINNIVGVDGENLEINLYTSWYRMVENFTSRKLTYQDDKLPAIAGLAKKFAAIANGFHIVYGASCSTFNYNLFTYHYDRFPV
jgi:hypothetical protein